MAKAPPVRREPDPYLISTTEAATICGQSPAAFRNRWDPAEDGWAFRVNGRKVIVPNVPNGGQRRVPVRTLQEVLHPQARTAEAS